MLWERDEEKGRARRIEEGRQHKARAGDVDGTFWGLPVGRTDRTWGRLYVGTASVLFSRRPIKHTTKYKTTFYKQKI